MTLSTRWLPWIVVALIGASVLYELVTGRARLRGIGVYGRTERPGAYWGVLCCKGLLAALVAALAAVGFWR